MWINCPLLKFNFPGLHLPPVSTRYKFSVAKVDTVSDAPPVGTTLTMAPFGKALLFHVTVVADTTRVGLQFEVTAQALVHSTEVSAAPRLCPSASNCSLPL